MPTKKSKAKTPAKPTERDRWIALVLWMHGLSAGEIALFLSRTRSSTLSLCQKGPFPTRAAMTIEERQHALSELRAIRYDDDGVAIDKGMLPDRIFMPRTLSGAQTRDA